MNEWAYKYSKAFTKGMNMFFRKFLFGAALINMTSGCVSYQAQQAAVNTVGVTSKVLTNVVKTTVTQPCSAVVTAASLFYPHAIFMTSVPTTVCSSAVR